MTSWEIEIFLELFFQRSSRLVKVMVKLWGGVSCILIEGVRSTFIQLLIFLLILLIFIDFIDFLSILLILLILLIFYRFYWFLSILLIFTDFIDFSTILSIFVDFLTSFAYFQQFLNKFSPIIGPISFWSATWCTISTKSYCGGHTTFGRIFGSWRGIKLKLCRIDAIEITKILRGWKGQKVNPLLNYFCLGKCAIFDHFQHFLTGFNNV